MIVILVHNPNYAASTELVKAFSLIGPTELVSLTRGHEMYQRDPGHLIDQELEACRDLVRGAVMVVFGDASAFSTMAALFPIENWGGVLEGKRTVALLADSEYVTKPDFYSDLCDAHKITVFALPGYRTLNMHAIPFHHPFEWDGEIVKSDQEILVVHSPAQQNKTRVKGTREIEIVIGLLLAGSHPFRYSREMGLPYAEVIERKSHAHIFIDQFTPESKIQCLGRSGCEGLALGCVTLSSMYSAEMVKGYFEMPPVIALTTQEAMHVTLDYLTKRTAGELVAMGREGMDWARDTLSYAAFIRHILRHV